MTSINDTQETRGERMPEAYGLDASCIKDSGRQLLREYSGFHDEEINSHVEAIVSPYNRRSSLSNLANIQTAEEGSGNGKILAHEITFTVH